MSNYNTNYLSEFEQEFAGEYSNETEYENYNSESEFENYESEYEYEDESEYNSYNEFENDEFEYNFENEFEYGDRDRYFENRLYELFTNKYESEFEYDHKFNRILHEMERDYFWKRVKKFGGKALKAIAPIAENALKQIPGGAKYADLAKSLTTNPRNFLKTAVKTFGPMALDGVMPGAGTALGMVLNNEVVVPTNQAQQAAKNMVALAKNAYANLADNMGKIPPTSNPALLQKNMQTAAKNAVAVAKQKVSPYKGKQKKVIPRTPNSIVVVHPDKVIIYQ